MGCAIRWRVDAGEIIGFFRLEYSSMKRDDLIKILKGKISLIDKMNVKE